MDDEATLDNLNELLEVAGTSLGRSAPLIRDLDFNKQENVKRIADALTNIFAIQLEIYKERPDLTPPELRDGDK